MGEDLVPVNAGIPATDADFVPEEDATVNPTGAKNAGQIDLCGAAAASGKAKFHPTCRRVPDLPLSPDRLHRGTLCGRASR